MQNNDKPVDQAAPVTSQDMQARLTQLEIENAGLKQSLAQQPVAQMISHDFFMRAGTACLLLDATGVIVQANPAAATMLALPVDALIMHSLSGFMFKDQAVLQTQLDQVLLSGAPQGCEVRTMKANRELVLLQISLARIASADGQSYISVLLADISRRQNNTLSASESIYFGNVVANNVPGMLAYWNKDLRCTFANHEYLTWFGRTPAQMHNITMPELLGEELFSKNIAYIHAVLKGTDQQFERTLIKANGEVAYTWAQYISHKVDGVVLGFFVLVTDITLLKRAQIGLMDSEAKNRAILRALPDIIFTLDSHGKFVDVHAPRTELLPVPPAQLLQSDVASVMPPDVAALYMTAIDAALTTTQVVEFRYDVSTATHGDMKFEARVVFKRAGRVIAIVRDVTQTERERRQRELQLSEQMQGREKDLRDIQLSLTMVSDINSLGTWVREFSSDHVWASLQWRQLFGFSSDEALNMAMIMPRIHPADRQNISGLLGTYNENHQRRYQAEYRVVLPDGSQRWVAAVWQVEYDAQEQPQLSRGVAIDISARKTAELELSQKRLEVMHLSRVATMGELSGALAHELNQPLTAILSNAQAALRFLARDDYDPQDITEILQDIVDEDKRAGEVIRRLRRLFDKHTSTQQSVDVNLLVLEVLHILRNDMIHEGVTLRSELQDNLPVVYADPIQIQQVIINLIMNACDVIAGLDESRRIIEIHTALYQTDQVLVSVDDHGPGIAPESRSRIFDAFYTTKPAGMGLGLSICKNIVEASGGRLWCESHEGAAGQGASFRFLIPAAKGDA